MALESFPAVTLLSLRFLISGSLMLAGAVITGARLPRGRELWLTAAYGVLVLGVGTGCLVFAEEWIPSGLAALFVTTSPFWLVGVEALAPGGEPLHGPSMKGMLVGCAGVAFLVAPALTGTGANHAVLIGFLLMQLGVAGWSLGSIAQRKQVSQVHPFISGAVQQLATGLVYAIPALLTRTPIHWTARGTGALIYLVLFGSIVGYSAYIFAMDRLPVAIASIYTYINPIVAVILGWLVYREPFGVREAIAAAVVFVGVAMVKRASVPVKKLGADHSAENRQDREQQEKHY
jgi:drug/metabolite transporter (DMT)-like permease